MRERDSSGSEAVFMRRQAQTDAFPRLVLTLLFLITAYFTAFFLSGCASVHELPPPPPKYVYKDEKPVQVSTNSLWLDTASLYEDRKARRLNDLVTIKVIENTTASGKASTSATRDSSGDYSLADLFGMSTDFNIQNLPFIKDYYKRAAVFTPSAKGAAKSDFDGKGDTTREGKLLGTITAKVVEVMPNGNLVLESRKDLTINNEKQTLVLRGMIRPDDVLPDNTILSGAVADADIFFVGDGVLQEKQKPGWLARVLDQVWPF
jgi:flagellar L-ring protein FlgH